MICELKRKNTSQNLCFSQFLTFQNFYFFDRNWNFCRKFNNFFRNFSLSPKCLLRITFTLFLNFYFFTKFPLLWENWNFWHFLNLNSFQNLDFFSIFKHLFLFLLFSQNFIFLPEISLLFSRILTLFRIFTFSTGIGIFSENLLLIIIWTIIWIFFSLSHQNVYSA